MVKYLHGIKLIESDFGLYLYDAHGNVTGILDSNYDISQSYTYDPFGADIVSAAESEIRDPEEMQSFIPDAGIMSSGIQIGYIPENPYRYCGEYTDTETGYVYLRARYYDPTIGRFISEDSAKDGYNWYVYCGNDPVNYVDPSGEFALIASLLIGAAIGIASCYANDVISNYQSGLTGLSAWTPSSSVFDYALSGIVGGMMGLLGVGVPWASMSFCQTVAMGGFMGIAGQTLYSFGHMSVPTVDEMLLSCVAGMCFNALTYGVNSLYNLWNNRYVNKTSSDIPAAKQKTYQTYTKYNNETGEVYSGRTSGYGTPKENVAARDAYHHMNRRGFGSAKLDVSSTNYDAIRGREQLLIEHYGGAKSMGGTSGNKINGISPTNPKRDLYINLAKELFGEL